MIPRHSAVFARAGFTLVEVLVSSAVLAIVMAVLFAALSTSLSLWRNTDNKIIADREARAVELMLVRDLGNVVMPSTTNLWPQVFNDNGIDYLRFLTALPPDAQDATGAEVGDVCYVEYAVLPSTNGPGKELRRLFWPSSTTFTRVLSPGGFPAPQARSDYQSLGLNLVPTNSMAARGLGRLSDEANNTHFVVLGEDMLPLGGASTATNPAAIEVNFAVADPDTLRNTNLISSPGFILRNAGLYSFRIPLPKPASP